MAIGRPHNLNTETGIKGFTRTVAISSGKGGVGKTTLAANLAYKLGASGRSVLILDGDLSMANVNILFGVKPEKSIQHALWGQVSMEETLVKVAPNVYLLPGGSGTLELQSLSDIERLNLLDQVSQLKLDFDFMLIDTAPGIDPNVLYLNVAAQERLLILTPDPSSLADCYALIKVLNRNFKQDRFSIVCNMVAGEEEGFQLFSRFSDVVSRFLHVGLDYKGAIPTDQFLRKATKSQQLIVRSHPQSDSSRAICGLSKKLNSFNPVEDMQGSIQFFWQQLFSVA